MNKLYITPHTKIAELLNNYPELEDKLIDLVPEFKKLKNPFLRKTIAKIANLEQAAKIGNIDIGTLINFLRKEVGQELYTSVTQTSSNDEKKPEWVSNSVKLITFDAREMINAGNHPAPDVVREALMLETGQVLELITPFLPAPLIDMVNAKGFNSWSEKVGDNIFKTYFIKS